MNESHGQKATAPATLPELTLGQKRYKLDWPEYIIAPLIALIAGIWAFQYIGTAIGWDDLFYLGTSQHTTKQAWVMNRYAHIYMQKFFFWLADDAISGAKLYWCFLFFSTVVFVYFCARMLAGKKGYIIGLVAALLFISQPLFVQCAGCTDVDLTIMFLFMLATFIYLAFFVGRYKYRHLIIVLLGLLFFWVMKSKETGIFMAVLFFGLGEDKTGTRSITRFVRDIGWICLGMVIGSVLLMSLDQIFLKDFWFSVRPSTIEALFSYNINEFAPERIRSWYTILSIDHIITVFLLYLLYGWKPHDKDSLSRHELLIWLIPLSILFFIIGINVHVTSATPRRYISPALAGFCIWAAQFFKCSSAASAKYKNAKNNLLSKDFLINSVIVLAAFIIVLTVMRKIPDGVKSSGWNSFEKFYNCVIFPLATTGLLLYTFVFRKRNRVAIFVLSLCLFFIIYFPFSNNVDSLKQRIVAKKSEYRYTPYRIFADELRFDKDGKILVSKDVHKRTWMLGRKQSSHYDMFNVFFNQHFDRRRFVDGTWEDILKADYTYGFITFYDWNGLSQKHDVEHLENKYALKANKSIQVILLKKR